MNIRDTHSRQDALKKFKEIFIASLGEFALYHSRNGYTGIVVGVSKAAKEIRQFFESIQDQIEEIYVFEKSRPQTNAEKAPELAVAMSMFVKSGIKVNRLTVEDYQFVICDSLHNQVLLFKNGESVESIKEAKSDQKYNKPGDAIDVTQSISIEETIKQISDKRDDQEKINDKTGNIVYPDNLSIPERFSDLLTVRSMGYRK